MTRFSLIFAALLLSVCSCSGENAGGRESGEGNYVTEGTSALALPYIMGNHMVLQQNADVNIFGTANRGVKVTVEPGWSDRKFETIVPDSGHWIVKIPTPAASFTSHDITVRDSQKGIKKIYNVLVGEVWMTAGQSNMEHPMRGFGSTATGNYQPVLDAESEIRDTDIPSFRYFKDKYQLSQVPMDNTKESAWELCKPSASPEFEAMAFFFGKALSETLNVPVGIIGCAYGGTRIESWMPVEVLASFSASDYQDAADLGDPGHKSAPGNIYNGMVLPVMDYTIRGWLWYQGESNRDNAHAYARLQEEMVACWRAAKGDKDAKLPFYFMQIAPFKSSDDISGAELRAAQMEAFHMIPNSGISSAGDVGDYSTIHYPNKKVPASRLVLWPLYNEYGRKDINPMGPVLRSAVRSGSVIKVTLDNAEGLHIDGASTDFAQVAGSDGKLVKAEVKLADDGTLEFSAPSVSAPVEVRYCYSTWHVSNIYNGAGLPVFPFKAKVE